MELWAAFGASLPLGLRVSSLPHGPLRSPLLPPEKREWEIARQKSQSFSKLMSAARSHHICHFALIRRQSLGPAHIKGKRLNKGMQLLTKCNVYKCGSLCCAPETNRMYEDYTSGGGGWVQHEYQEAGHTGSPLKGCLPHCVCTPETLNRGTKQGWDCSRQDCVGMGDKRERNGRDDLHRPGPTCHEV